MQSRKPSQNRRATIDRNQWTISGNTSIALCDLGKIPPLVPEKDMDSCEHPSFVSKLALPSLNKNNNMLCRFGGTCHKLIHGPVVQSKSRASQEQRGALLDSLLPERPLVPPTPGEEPLAPHPGPSPADSVI